MLGVSLQQIQLVLQLYQALLTTAVGALDLYVIYRVVGVFRHRKEIGAWMDRAFTGDGLKVMTKCPRCGYEERPPPPVESQAERLLRERGGRPPAG
jgi:hypothetical protein